MQSLACSEIRRRLVEQIVGALGETWTHDTGAPEQFGRLQRPLEHKSFSVATPSTTPIPGQRHSARGGVERLVFAATTVSVRYAYRIALDDQHEDYGAALDAEAELLAAVLDTVRDPKLRPVFEGASRESGGDGSWLVGRLDFTVRHPFALSAEAAE